MNSWRQEQTTCSASASARSHYLGAQNGLLVPTVTDLSLVLAPNITFAAGPQSRCSWDQRKSLKLFVGVGSFDDSRPFSIAQGGLACVDALIGETALVDEGRLHRVSPVFLWL